MLANTHTCEKAMQGKERVTEVVMNLWHKTYFKRQAKGSKVE